MTIGPINVTRVSHNLRTQSLLESLQRGQLELFVQQNRLSLGRRFLSPSDDPVAAAQSLDLTEILETQAQLSANVGHGDNLLNAADSSLTDVSDLLIEAHGIASQSLGALSTAEERAASAELIGSIIDQLTVIANREFQGRYLFAGRATQNQPFVAALGGIAYLGDDGRLTTRVARDELDEISFTGQDVFGALAGRVRGSVDLDPLLTENTRLEDLAGATGEGIRTGVLVIQEEGGGAPIEVDLSTADTISDVVNLINQAAADAGSSVTASLTDVGLTITPGGASITVTDSSAGQTASDLGVLTTEPQGAAIVGADLNVRITATTAVENLMAGAGVNLEDGLIITNGGKEVTVDLSDAETIQDILNRINNASVYVRAGINEAGTGIDVINLISGTQMSIGENGGTTATELGLRSLDLDTPLSQLNNGAGVETKAGLADIRITSKDPAAAPVDVNLDDAQTLGDVITAINDAATDAGVAIEASLAETGNGIRIVDSTGGAGSLSVSRLNLSYALDDLGLEKSVDDPETELVSDDTNTVQADNALTALVDLQQALYADDEKGISDAAQRISEAMDDVVEIQGRVGAKSKAMQDRLAAMEDANLATETFLSQVKDVDYAEAITRFQQAQTALQASMLTGSRLLDISLLDYL